METIYINRDNLADWQGKADACVIALGFFDGLHYGHREVIKTALRKAQEKGVQLSVMSFFPHPKSVLSNGEKQIDYLMPLSGKEKILRGLGVDTFYIVEFTREFAALSPEQYVNDYLVNLGVIHAVAGFDFTYGSRGIGNLDRLQGDSGGSIEVTKVEKVACRGEKISSTSIRERLAAGNVEELPDFLGCFYEIAGMWDGQSFKLNPYYTLPAPGKYAVTINIRNLSKRTEVIVEENSLKPVSELPLYLFGELSIVWHKRISEDASSSRPILKVGGLTL
ncbi:adenylyltransferase/cytidyltransferase family protein [Neobacillus sp. NPDC093182]|uniref:adenylyltransferase/cytidyltransferase family protein n=1 Tax=Neobacillus sp. NPDC093182 TaxID=3364297 RepID=UPI00380DA332